MARLPRFAVLAIALGMYLPTAVSITAQRAAPAANAPLSPRRRTSSASRPATTTSSPATRQIVEYFREARRRLRPHRRRGDRQERREGRPMIARDHLERGQHQEPRALPGDRPAAGARRAAWTRPRPARSRRKARPSSGSTAACTRPRSPTRSTRRSWRGGWSPSESDEAKRVRDNAILLLMPLDEPRRPRHRPRLVHEEPRHALRDDDAAGAVPPLHRPRQQPRLDDVHAGRDAGGGAAALHGVVPADRLQPPPVGPVPQPHLGTADEGPGEPQPRSAGREHRSTRSARRCASASTRRRSPATAAAHALRHLVERQHARRPRLPQHGRLPHRDVALPAWRRRTATRPRRFPRRSASAHKNLPAKIPSVELHEPVAGRLLAAPQAASST